VAETKFTPGPWSCEPGPGAENGFEIEATEGGESLFVLATSWFDSDGDKESMATAHANGRLIAAAPDLFAACRAALIAMNSHTTEPIPVGVYSRVARLLGDAIAKAEGDE
jgi:hypothetical protein